MNGTVSQAFEAKYKTKIVYEGTRSLVNLEKMQKNKDKQYLSVVMMDDPVMIPAVAEGLLEKLTAAKVPNLAMLKPGTVHMDGMWCNYLQPWLGIAYNPKALKTAPASWADIYDPKYKGRIILPSLQKQDVHEGTLSANARYRVLNEQIFAARGEDMRIAIDGAEHLLTHSDSITPEAACTSVQLHLQVSPDAFASYWNAANRNCLTFTKRNCFTKCWI